ncbi:MAG: tannase/feruloyl esterase family alpha/beta hydrolase [Alphaproteobacteria bacterium]|nr:tannase/feruloyl esterase family alpha/beta hydrolase [Alphaproteobacteria bacterium]
MDSGHWGAASVDGRWVHHNRLAEIDWGSRAVTETARVTKAVIRAFYGQPQQRAYLAGCSTGGRMAAMEAQRCPDDVDGIIASAPALDYAGLVATFFAWLVKANTGPDGKDILPRSKVPLVRDAVMKQCDAKGEQLYPGGLSAQTGPGITEFGFDPLTALERWVEQGRAPDSLLATKADREGRTLWTRPLCLLPRAARYRGTGDPNDAANFTRE